MLASVGLNVVASPSASARIFERNQICYARHLCTLTPHRCCTRRSAVSPCAVEASAESSLPSQPSDIPEGTLLHGKYKVEAMIGRGGNGTTYRCRDEDTHLLVAVKALTLRSLKDWKQLELFQREAQILENLDHPSIPKYIDTFEEDTPTDKAFFIVQEIVSGKPLQDMIAGGWRADEAEIIRIALALLDTLTYLSERRPPVVHRDIKPANIIMGGGKTGGRIYLIDFGGVQAVVSTDTLPGTTIVGTFGFMAPEQFRGAAEPASDLYSLGATLLYIISGRLPSTFPTTRMRLDVSGVSMGSRLRTVVEGLLEPVVEDRLMAKQAMRILRGQNKGRNESLSVISRQNGGMRGSVFGRKQQDKGRNAVDLIDFGQPSTVDRVRRLRKPIGSRITLTRQGNRLIIDIPPAKFDGSSAATGGFALVWNSFVAFWTVSALAAGGVLFALFSLPFWFVGIGLLRKAFGRQLIQERIEIGAHRWTLYQKLARIREGKADWSSSTGKMAEGNTADVSCADLEIVAYVNGVPQAQLQLRQGVEKYIFGEGLDPVEQEWLVSVINSHLEELREATGSMSSLDEEF